MRRNILITGATGKQGQALIRAIFNPETPHVGLEYHVYGVTRHASSPGAQHLSSTFGEENLTLLEGDLDDRSSVSRVFQDVKSAGGIWGVFAVLPFPGLGMPADGEERQGKILADLALEFSVAAFLYSSQMRGGPKYEDRLDLKASGQAKANIEQHCMKLGESGLNWTILRPGFFIENFDGFIGSISAAILKKGLKDDTTIGIIATEDIGNVVAGVFRDHERYRHKVLVVVSEFPTMKQLEDSHKRATGKPIPAVPAALAWILVKMNKATQDLIKDIEQGHHARSCGDYPGLEGEVALANSAYRMKTYYERLIQGNDGKGLPGKWNQVTLGKLLTGRM